MLDQMKTLLGNQLGAAIRTLAHAVERCPDSAWLAPVVNWKFCQVAFHTAFFADLYLGRGIDGLRGQPFHRSHADAFRDYEELEPRPPAHTYERTFIERYIEHCRVKSAAALAAETAETFAGPSGFEWLKITRAEVYPYNARHIQHHAAQLSLRLRSDHNVEVPWVRSGWPG